MKRLIMVMAALLMLVAASCFSAMAEPAGNLPAEIRDFFDRSSFEGMTVLSTANGIEIGGRDACYAVLVRTAKKENVLYMFRQNRNGTAWKYSFSTGSAVPQTGHDMEVNIQYSGWEWPTDDFFDTPHLNILQMDAGNEYTELCVSFELDAGKWLLHRIWSYTGYDSMLIREGSISYYRELESNEIAGVAKGDFQRDLRYVSLSAVPKTLAEARAKLTVAPVLPSSDELKVTPVRFAQSEKYDVYSAPDKTSLRGANGKARVSTNSWIQVFGTEGDWVLIQYSIDAAHYRFGYISSASLPKKANVPALSFQPMNAWTTSAAELTDDPLYSRAVLLSLQEGSQVAWLATLGEWAYVEVSSGDWARGFVPLSCITVLREFDMRNEPGENGEVVYDGFVTLYPDDRLELELRVAQDGPLGNAAVGRILVTDTFGGSVLAMLSPDSNGTYFGNCTLGGDVTSVTLTAADNDGNAFSPIVRVEW